MASLTTFIRHYLTRHRQVVSIPCPGFNALTGLPVEILLSIGDHLSQVDLTCLSLCNHRLFQIFRTRTNLGFEDKDSILIRLERDLARYFFCAVCHILHDFDGSENFGMSGPYYTWTCPDPYLLGSAKSLWGIMESHSILYDIYYHLRFIQVKLAMRRYQYGLAWGINIESLNYTQVSHYTENSDHPETTWLFSRDAEICPNPPALYVRMQDIILAKRKEDPVPHHGSYCSDRPPYIFQGCSHLPFTTFIPDILKGRYATYQCRKCVADCCIEIKEFDSQFALVFTKWTNLGSGLTREDPHWKVHAYFDIRKINAAEAINAENFVSPRSCFEGLVCEKLDDLTSRNLSYLENQKYRRIMCAMSTDFKGRRSWHITYKEPSKPKFWKGAIGKKPNLRGLRGLIMSQQEGI
ncbi:hypothetical protein N7456_012418 [Penicillium angulare]|uniref:F-box domain-containing protein n=1 Tax=Penicillium angulare TaxID=116970 RepID=A0A9W9K1M9_9EURO|nr:hypothetical protein N7456_012418 [Penicillium angulare]